MLARAVVAGREVGGRGPPPRPRWKGSSGPEQMRQPCASIGGGQPIDTSRRRRLRRRWRPPSCPSWCPRTTRRAGIAATLASLHATLDALGAAYEVIVVDNASGDGTAGAVAALGDARMRVLRNADNLGKGALGAPRDARGRRRAAAALRRRLRPVGARAARAARARRARRRRRRLAARARAPRSAGASRCGGGSPGALRGCCAAPCSREPTRDLFCGFKLWRAEAAEAAYRALARSTAGPSTPRRSRWPARSASAIARSGSRGPTARARGSRCRA